VNTEPRPPEQDPAKARRDKLIGRLMVVGFVVLILLYAIPTFLNARG